MSCLVPGKTRVDWVPDDDYFEIFGQGPEDLKCPCRYLAALIQSARLFGVGKNCDLRLVLVGNCGVCYRDGLCGCA